MDADIVVSIPVSAEAASLLRDSDRVKAVGRLVDTMLFPQSPRDRSVGTADCTDQGWSPCRRPDPRRYRRGACGR